MPKQTKDEAVRQESIPVKLILTADQYARLSAAAEAAGLPKASYARVAMLRGLRTDPDIAGKS